jgi:hypothetical protein
VIICAHLRLLPQNLTANGSLPADPTCEEAWYDEGWVDVDSCECSAFGCLDCIEFDLHEPHCPNEDCTRNDFCSLADSECDYYCQFEANGQGGLIPVFNGCFMGSECNYVCGCGTPESPLPAVAAR